MSYNFNIDLGIVEHNANTTFITTAIDYPNALPHIGTAFEKIGADVYARFRRSQGRDVYFLMGNDENTLKVVKAAEDVLFGSRKDRWELPRRDYQQYVDIMAGKFKEVWKKLNISFDDFIQTSEERHRMGVQLFLNVVNKAGYIEKRKYTGWYCEGCEEFKKESDRLPGTGQCPNHPTQKLVERDEENYFFKLSEFQKYVADLLTPTPFVTTFLSIEPPSRENEVRAFVDNDLQDISISRKNTFKESEGWGIPIPWDESQITYVWFDALLNYLTGIGFGTDWEKFAKYWPAEVHFIGKDITRFHGALFPAMIEAYNRGVDIKSWPAGLPKVYNPQRIVAHGFVNEKKDGRIVKSSKSGDSTNPVDLIDQFGADAYRYYFLSKFNYDTDGVFTLDHFKDVYNSDLANSLGNLVNRVHAMTVKYFDRKLPAIKCGPYDGWLNSEKCKAYEEFIVPSTSFRHALELTFDVVRQANLYIDLMKPWEIAKSDIDLCAGTLTNLAASLRVIGLLLKPFMPETAEKVYNTFNWSVKWDETNWQSICELAKNNMIGLENGITASETCNVFFPRIK
jgi:methionyl-tRNA synthetase